MRWTWLTPRDKKAMLILTAALLLAMVSGLGVIAGLLFLVLVVMWSYLTLRRGRPIGVAEQAGFWT